MLPAKKREERKNYPTWSPERWRSLFSSESTVLATTLVSLTAVIKSFGTFAQN